MLRKSLSILLLIALVVLAALGGWHFGRRNASSTPSSVPTTAAARKVLFYQSPMHPWIKSDRPGNCTICGMKLVPVFEGDAGADSPSATVIRLSAQSATVTNIESTAVARQPIRRFIRVAGQIDDDDSTHRRLSAYVEARIEKLHVNFVGAEVTAGQPLAAFYSKDLLVARGEYTLALKQPPSAQRDATIAASKAKLRRMGLTPEQIEGFPGQTGDTFEIVAPITGTVVERKVYEGQYVKEGDVLFEIADFSRMWFVFDAYERDLAWVRVGQPVEITTPSVPGKVFTAPVAFIDPNLMPQTRTAKVRVVLENPMAVDPGKHRHELLHKIYADGRIRVETEPVLTVPRSAVLSPGGEAMVYLVKNEREYEPRRVTLGRAGDDVWEVLAGVQEGDRVVTTGNLLIDAQAQLAHPAQAPASSPPLTVQTDAQRVLAEKLFATAASVGEALAADDLAAHNTRIAALHEAAIALGAELGTDGQRLTSVAHVRPATDLTSARKQFYPLSMAVAELALHVRPATDASKATVKVFECPMAKSAVPSAETNQGRWVQLQAPLRNPFFGAEMLECGKEIKP